MKRCNDSFGGSLHSMLETPDKTTQAWTWSELHTGRNDGAKTECKTIQDNGALVKTGFATEMDPLADFLYTIDEDDEDSTSETQAHPVIMSYNTNQEEAPRVSFVQSWEMFMDKLEMVNVT